ncbi:DUF7373 family lipoprotein [Nocardia heshunensis]
MGYGTGRLPSACIRLCAVAGAMLTVLSIAACGSGHGAAQPDSVDLTKLDTGGYATKPQPVAPADPDRAARYLEAIRLGEVMPLAKDIDPALTYNPDGAYPFTNAATYADANLGIVDYEHFAANTPGFVGGFGIYGQSNRDLEISYSLSAAALLFDTDEQASTAVPALAHTGFSTKYHFDEGSEPASSAAYPSARGVWTPDTQILASWYATGRFVIVTVADNPEDESMHVSDQAGLVARSDHATAVIAERLKNFHPTPADKRIELPLDPAGMIRRTLQRPVGDLTYDPVDGVFDRNTALHLAEDPDETRRLYDKTGIEFLSTGAGELVRARDAAGAAAYIEAVSIDKFHPRIDSPPGLPSARCVTYHGPKPLQFPFHCYVSYGRYAATVWSQQVLDAYQRISAQYAILANDK